MDNNDDKLLQYVLSHYRKGLFDTGTAWKEFSGRIEGPSRTARARERRASMRWLWLVPAMAAIVLAVFFRWQGAWTEYRSYDVPQAFTLADGTRVTLAPGATLRYQVRKDPRKVSMSGKIHYDVARDESHPFTISLAQACVEVLGTTFQVAGSDSTVRVDVMSGKVRFSGPEDDGIILTAGQSGQLSGGVPVRCEPAGPNPAAWVGGRFRYDATPLGTVLAELSDYYGVRLSVGSGNGEGKCLTGDFSTDSLDEILEIVESVLEVSVVRQ